MNRIYQEDIPGILIVSHGPLCTALLESARLISGEAKNVVAMPLLENASIEAYGAEAMQTLRAMPDGSIVLFDLVGGTPFNQMMQCSNGECFPGLCGVNLPVLLEAMAIREIFRGEELVAALASSARESIVDIRTFFE